ncbi:MAG: hypothetical protein ABW128_20655 [Rhizorhabdus sp.]
MTLRHRRMLALIVVGGAGAMSAAQAQTGSSERVLRSFSDCRAIAAPDARLACFDKAAASLEAAVKAKDVTIVDRQDVRKARRSLFGFTLPKIDLFGGSGPARPDEKEDAFTELNTTVASSRPVANGRVEIRLVGEGDPVWQTTDPMNFPPRAGEKIRIRQGTLGNYFLFVGGRSYRGMRLR